MAKYSFPEVPAGAGYSFDQPKEKAFTKMNTKAEAMEKLMTEPLKYAGALCSDHMRAYTTFGRDVLLMPDTEECT